MSKEKNVPRLRFPGFTDDWEQRKLSEVLDIVTNKNENRFGKEDVLSVSDEYGCINQIKFQGRSFAGEDISNYKIVDTGDIIYTRSPLKSKPYGIIKVVGKETGIVSPLYIVNKPKEGYDSQFVYRVFDSPEKTNNYLSPLVRKGAKNTMNISNDEWLSGDIIVSPSYKEQRKIGEYFEQLDNLITLHQRKSESLSEYKLGMLQKMFPREGEREPEVRFPGFTGAWEQRKCKDIFDKVGVLVEKEDTRLYREIGIRSHGKGIFYKDEVTGKELGDKRVFWIEPDCFVVNIVFAWERAVAKTTKNEMGMIASHRFPMYKPKKGIVDLDYITKFFTTNKGKEILEMASPGGAGRNKTLGQKEFANSVLFIPSYDEQKKIGSFIDKLDSAITLHQRKCEELKEYKRGLLQQMFI